MLLRFHCRCLALFALPLVAACGDDSSDDSAGADVGQTDTGLDIVDDASGNDALTDATDDGSGSTGGPELVQTEFDDVPYALRCPTLDDGTNCVEPRSNAVRLDDETTLGWARADFDGDTQTLRVRLEDGATLDGRIVEGAMLYRGRRDRAPLMHRVRSVAHDGQEVTIELERANVKDVFERGRIRVRVPIGVEGEGPAPKDGLGIAQLPIGFSIGVDDCSGSVFDQAVGTPQAQGNISLSLSECRFELAVWVDAVIAWDNLVNLDKVELVVGGSAEAVMHAALELSLNGGINQAKTLWNGPEIPISIAGILITINPSLEAGYELSASAQLTVEQGFDYYGEVEQGFGWSDRRDWYTIDRRESDFTAYGPDVYFDGNATARVFLRPRLDLKAFGIIGGYIFLEGWAEAALTSTASRSGRQYTGEVCADLDVGLTPGIGAVCEIPATGITLFEESIRLPSMRLNLINNLCTDWAGPAPDDCAASSECCVDSDCAPPESSSATVSCEPGPATTGGTRYSCETTYPDDYCVTGSETAGDAACDDGSRYTDDRCVDDHCEHQYPGQDDAFAAAGAGATAQAELDCPVPGLECCYVDSDCADGIRTSQDECVKALPFAGPEVRGTCVHHALDEVPFGGGGGFND